MRMTKTPLILIVDDEPLIARLHGRAVAALGYRHDVAHSADEAMEAMAAEKPQLVLTDLNMPGEDGLRFATRVKHLHPGIPVLLMSGDDNVDILLRGLRAGVDDFLYKGMNFELLSAVLRFWAEGPLGELPRYIRRSVLGYFDMAWPLGPPIRQMRGDLSELEDRATMAFRDLVYRTKQGFGASTTEQIRLLGALEGILATLTRSTPLAQLRIPGLIARIMTNADLDLNVDGLNRQFGRIDELVREPTFQHARQTLVLAA
jgi:DNA-binding response OmpR family regulator